MSDIMMYEGLNGFAGKRARRRGARTATQRKFKKCAKKCRGSGPCMRKCIRGRRRR